MNDYITAAERLNGLLGTPWQLTAIYTVVLLTLIFECFWTIGGY